MAVDQNAYSAGVNRKYWDPTDPEYEANKNSMMGQYWRNAKATMSPEQWAAELARGDQSYASRPHGILSAVKPAAIIGGILAGGFAGAALTGGAGAAAAGGGAAGGGASVLPAAGAAASGAANAGGWLGAVKDYGPLVLGGASAISGANAQGKQNELMERAMRLSEQDYASRAPLREQAIRMTALPPPPRPVLAQLSDAANPYHQASPPPSPPPSGGGQPGGAGVPGSLADGLGGRIGGLLGSNPSGSQPRSLADALGGRIGGLLQGGPAVTPGLLPGGPTPILPPPGAR